MAIIEKLFEHQREFLIELRCCFIVPRLRMCLSPSLTRLLKVLYHLLRERVRKPPSHKHPRVILMPMRQPKSVFFNRLLRIKKHTPV